MLNKTKSYYSGKKLCILIVFTMLFSLIYADFSFAQVTDMHVASSAGLADIGIGHHDLDGKAFKEVIYYLANLANKPDFVIGSGDISDAGNWGLDGMYPAITQHLDRSTTGRPGFGDWHIDPFEHIPIYFIPGNHDYRCSNILPTFVSLNSYGQYIGPLVKLGDFQYAGKDSLIDKGNAVIICLDSGHDSNTEPEGSGLRDEQITWLEAKLVAANTAGKKKIITLHHPVVYGNPGDYTLGTISENRAEFIALCDTFNVDIVLSGHVHSNGCNDKDGNDIGLNVTTNGTRYITTDTTMDGYYRMIHVDATSVTVDEPVKVPLTIIPDDCKMGEILDGNGTESDIVVKNELTVLRQFRDKVLKPSQFSKYVKPYYKHSAEVLKICVLHPNVRSGIKKSIKDYIPAFKALSGMTNDMNAIQDMNIILTKERVEELDGILKEIQKYAGSSLSSEIMEIRKLLSFYEGQSLALLFTGFGLKDSNVTELYVNPDVIVPGDSITVTGKALPDEEVWITYTQNYSLPVDQNNNYNLSIDKFPLFEGEKVINFIVEKVISAKIRLKKNFLMIFNDPESGYYYPGNNIFNRTFALFSQGLTFQNVSLSGTACSTENHVDAICQISYKVIADEFGNFSFKTPTNIVPIGYFEVSAGDLTKIVKVVKFSNDFESSFENWTNVIGDNFDWTRRSGGTPSYSTGPSSAHGGSYYIYTESSYPNYGSKIAIVEGPTLDFDYNSNLQIDFWYHMYGSSMGTLYLEENTTGSWVTKWSKSGDQGNSWKNATIDLSSLSGTGKLRFRGLTGSSYRSDMALDDITIESCYSSPQYELSNPSFENSESWTSTSTGGSYAPTMILQSTDGPHTGNYCARISNNLGGAGTPRSGYFKQTISLPADANTLNYYVKYWKSSWGAGIGVKVKDTNDNISAYKQEGSGGSSSSSGWTARSIDVSSYAGQNVIIEIYLEDLSTTYAGYCDHGAWIAVDDFSVASTVISNPGFESSSSWTTTSTGGSYAPTMTLQSTDGPHTGNYCARISNNLGGAGTPRSGYFNQSIILPADANTLNYYVKYWKSSWGAPVGVKVKDTNDNTLAYKREGSGGTSSSSGWTARSISVSAYAGQNVIIEIYLEDLCTTYAGYGDHGAWIAVDDFSVNSSKNTNSEQIPELPNVYSLSPNYPNPFNPETTIKYSLQKAGNVSLKVYNIKGQLVKTLIDENKESGNHSVVWTGKNNNNRKVASGVYFYRIKAGKFTDLKKMLLIK